MRSQEKEKQMRTLQIRRPRQDGQRQRQRLEEWARRWRPRFHQPAAADEGHCEVLCEGDREERRDCGCRACCPKEQAWSNLVRA